MNNSKYAFRSGHKGTEKWNFLQKHFLGKIAGLEPIGERIILPSNINGLKERLQLVCVERAAENIDTTTPEIVAILDELLQQRYISKMEYNEFYKRLGC